MYTYIYIYIVWQLCEYTYVSAATRGCPRPARLSAPPAKALRQGLPSWDIDLKHVSYCLMAEWHLYNCSGSGVEDQIAPRLNFWTLYVGLMYSLLLLFISYWCAVYLCLFMLVYPMCAALGWDSTPERVSRWDRTPSERDRIAQAGDRPPIRGDSQGGLWGGACGGFCPAPRASRGFRPARPGLGPRGRSLSERGAARVAGRLLKDKRTLLPHSSWMS